MPMHSRERDLLLPLSVGRSLVAIREQRLPKSSKTISGAMAAENVHCWECDVMQEGGTIA